MEKKYLTVREFLNNTYPSDLIYSESFKDGEERTLSKGGNKDITYDKETKILEWEDKEGNPTVYNIELDELIICTKQKKKTWTYSVYVMA